MRCHCIHAEPTDAKTWTKPVQVAAVGKAVNNDRITPTISRALACYRYSMPFFEISYVPTCMTNSKRYVFTIENGHAVRRLTMSTTNLGNNFKMHKGFVSFFEALREMAESIF